MLVFRGEEDRERCEAMAERDNGNEDEETNGAVMEEDGHTIAITNPSPISNFLTFLFLFFLYIYLF